MHWLLESEGKKAKRSRSREKAEREEKKDDDEESRKGVRESDAKSVILIPLFVLPSGHM